MSRSMLAALSSIALWVLPAVAADVTSERLVNAANEPQNWLMVHHDYGNSRHSALAEINRDTVQNLRPKFMFSIGGLATGGTLRGKEESTPLVEDGYMYVTDTWSRVMKFDVRSGTEAVPIWRYDPKIRVSRTTRGLAMYGNKIVLSTYDARLIALNRDSGELVWEVQAAAPTDPATGTPSRTQAFSAPPVAIKTAAGRELVIQGESTGGSLGTRSWIGAFDIGTGALVWRTFTIPAPGDPGSETWKDTHNAWRIGGASVWQAASYDPATNLLYFGTGDAFPTFDPEYRPGDNLYTASTLAVDADTGKIAWFFQETPNEHWDFDTPSPKMLFDTTINGEPRKVVANFSRNGFFYTLDRTTGAFIGGLKYVNELTWTKGLDPKTGKPVEYDPERDVQAYLPDARPLRGDPAKRACPTWHGGVSHQPAAYNPVKRIAYGVGIEGCFSTSVGPQAYLSPAGGLDRKKTPQRAFNSDLYYGGVTAIDVPGQKVLAKTTTEIEIRSGALATAGGLVFTALQDGAIVAYNDETLEELWRFNVGTPLKGSPVTYAIGSKQYVAVQGSGRHVHPVK